MDQMEQMARASGVQPKLKTKSIMFDLETLGTVADSSILSIGAVKFNHDGNYVDDAAFYTAVRVESQTDRRISGDTLAWWMSQSVEARAVFTDPDRMALITALSDLKTWIGDHKQHLLWSNGADFDLPMLNHALACRGMSPLGEFWNHRCYRTMKNEFNMVPQPEREGAHNALMDAIHQAKHLQAIYKFKQEGTIAVPTKGFSAK